MNFFRFVFLSTFSIQFLAGTLFAQAHYRDTSVIELKSQWVENVMWDLRERVTSTYDSRGNKTSEVSELKGYDDWNKWLKWTYAYDANGNKIADLKQEWANNTWENRYKTNYVYDAQNKNVSEITKAWNGNEWINSSEFLISYTKENNPDVFLRKDWQDSTWLVTKYTYTYTQKGKEISRVCEKQEKGNWINLTLSLSSYNEKDSLAERIYQDWEENKWINSSSYSYAYNEKGRITTETNKDWKDGAWVMYYKEKSNYDNSGRVIEKLKEYGVGEPYREIRKYDDTTGNLVLMESSYLVDGVWQNIGQSEFLYVDANSYSQNHPNGSLLNNLIENNVNIYDLKFYTPEKGDYLLWINHDKTRGHYLFKTSHHVYYDCNLLDGKESAPYEQDADRLKELFKAADELHLASFPKLAEPINLEKLAKANYNIMELKRGEKITRLCWDADSNDETAQKMSSLIGMMGSFW